MSITFYEKQAGGGLLEVAYPQMYFYWWREADKVCVQNAVMGHLGQYHEHTQEDFDRWVKETRVPEKRLIHLSGCDKE